MWIGVFLLIQDGNLVHQRVTPKHYYLILQHSSACWWERSRLQIMCRAQELSIMIKLGPISWSLNIMLTTTIRSPSPQDGVIICHYIRIFKFYLEITTNTSSTDEATSTNLNRKLNIKTGLQANSDFSTYIYVWTGCSGTPQWAVIKNHVTCFLVSLPVTSIEHTKL